MTVDINQREGTKEQLMSEDSGQGFLTQITLDQLNLPSDFEAMNAQTLLSSYFPPGNEDWLTGIFRCHEDRDICLTGLLCPCVLFGCNLASLNKDIPERNACICYALCVEGCITLGIATAACNGITPQTALVLTFFNWLMCGAITGNSRLLLQQKYHLKDSPSDPCRVHCFLHWCAICQEHREMKMKTHLDGLASEEVALINPPPLQQMKAGDEREDQILSNNMIWSYNLCS